MTEAAIESAVLATAADEPRVTEVHVRQTNRALWYRSLGTLCVTIVVSVIFAIFPIMRTSVLSLATGWFTSGPKSSGGKTLHTIFYGVFYFLLFGTFAFLAYQARHHKKKVNFFDGIYKAALIEEIKYRKGSEYWSWKRRVWVQLRFGAAHFWNLIVPLNVVVGLACAGIAYMVIYLKFRKYMSQDEATAVTALVHARYNLTVLVTLIVVGWGAILGTVIYHAVS